MKKQVDFVFENQVPELNWTRKKLKSRKIIPIVSEKFSKIRFKKIFWNHVVDEFLIDCSKLKIEYRYPN